MCFRSNSVAVVCSGLLFGLVATAATNAQTAPQAESTAAPYSINPGDILSITVWKEEDLQRQVLVRPDGSFSFPLAGDINATGKSVIQVQSELVQRLGKYIPDPVVTVATEQILGNKVYVLGQVNRPGEFVANTRMDITQALAMAGGFTPFAQKNDIKVIRRFGDTARAIEYDYGDIEKGKRLEQNILLQPGDTIVVP